jgi:hypothetical protein
VNHHGYEVDLRFQPLEQRPESWDDIEPESHPFSAGFSDTMRLLCREATMLAKRDEHVPTLRIQLAVRPSDIYRDGTGLKNDGRQPSHHGVVVSIDTEQHGVLTYDCAKYEDRWVYRSEQRGGSGNIRGWQANLRSIALGLEALRAVERYGIATAGQQYAGFAAIGTGMPMPAVRLSVDEAAKAIWEGAGLSGFCDSVNVIDNLDGLYAMAAKKHHPDAGGTHEAMSLLTRARDRLREVKNG